MSEIRFTNETSSTVWVAVMFYSPDGCAAYGQWGTRGWWQIAPGGTAFALRTNNRYAGYYAESANGTGMWRTSRPTYDQDPSRNRKPIRISASCKLSTSTSWTPIGTSCHC
jgi:Protein of unknown function (DUF1036)